MRRSILIAAGLMACAAQPAFAAVVTSLPGGTSVAIPKLNAYGAPATDIGSGISWSSSESSSVLGWSRGYGFSDNGSWSGTPMIGLNTGTGTMTLGFDQAVTGFLAEINWAAQPVTQYSDNDPAAFMSAYNAAGDLLETIQFTGGTAPGYYGFSREDGDIASIVFGNSYVGARNLSLELAPAPKANSVAFVSAPVPEPAAWAMMIAGFGLIGGTLRMRTRKVAYAAG
ncbi:MAG: hypothetical protein ABS87_01125 [Sphingomonas sp. SCN 67-18]|uniref:PEPxxWA-CTERM sorting domain-containing protein n=1 Tax=uncultured Sphingomonas sp. TaxID=158754 RepID=UPI00086D80C3|nr:PEPxxWA-CTERM sorting domain-containing protein [Sphingomonas sp. SCN 67-18]ODU22799.1 MAG: hypothetical protein ABS87_01125 [Sphingomonas sp. SCN 67-18]